ncbi:MAG: restriction endonuclease subunit S [Lacibacter sp.]
MSEWKEYKLEDLAEFHNQKRIPLSSMERSQRKGIFPYYGASGIIDYIDDYIFDGEYVLISEDGENLKSRQTPIAFIASGKFWVNNHAHIIKGKKPYLNKLIVYYFQNLDLNPFLTGAVQPKLNKATLTSIPIQLPESELEQTAIAEVLSSLDDKIDLLHRQNKTLEQLAETLFRQWFVEEADESWEIGNVNDLVKIQSGFAFKSSDFSDNGIYRIITIKNVQDGFLDSAKSDFLNSVPRNMPEHCLLLIGDILLSLTGNVGRCCLVDADNLLLNQRVAKLKPLNERDWAFTYIMFRQTSMRRTLEELAKGTAQANLSPIETGTLEIQIPPQKRLEYFSKEATPLIQKVLNNKLQIRTLTQLRDTLLPKLMSGEIRLNLDLQDELMKKI